MGRSGAARGDRGPRPAFRRAAAGILLGLVLAILPPASPPGTAASAPPGSDADGTPLRVGIYQNPPKLFLDRQGEPAGLFPDVLAAVAAELGWTLDYRSCTWTRCLEMLADGRIDILPDVARTPQRAAAFKFSQVPVLRSFSFFYSRHGTIVRSLDDLRGRTIAVLRDSVQHRALQEVRAQEDEFRIQPTDSHEASLQAVAGGTADLAVVNNFLGREMEARFALVRSELTFNPAPLYLGFSPVFDDAAIERADAVIAALQADPQSAYFAAYDRWLGPEPAPILPAWVYWVAGAALLALLVGTGFIFLLRRRVAQATRELRHSRESLIEAQILARFGDFTWDLQTDALDWSPGLRALLGFTADDPASLDRVTAEIHHPEDSDRVMRWIADGIDAGATVIGPESYRLVRKDGSIIHVEANVRIERAGGRAVRVFGTCHDVTARVMAENALLAAKQEAERMGRAKTDFLAGMSHELRTPLNAIIGFAEMLDLAPASVGEEKRRDYVHSIRQAGEQLLTLVNEILDLAGVEAGRMRFTLEAVEVDGIVAESIAQTRPIAERAGIEVHRAADGPVPRVLADPMRLRQVLLNYLSNAIRYNRRGGTVTVSAARQPDGWVRLSVADTGRGIPAARQAHVFDAVGSLRGDALLAGEGAGIGLTVVKRIAEGMGGRVGFESREGWGSTFWCDLPPARDSGPAGDAADTG